MKTDIELIRSEGWQIETVTSASGEPEHKVIAYGQEFPIRHPFEIYAKLFRNETEPELKYQFMKKMHDYLWPDTVWHYWTERRFKAHCKGYSYISFAGGTSTSKSYDTAKIVILWWLADPKHRGAVIASTSLDSLNGRIWGYILRLFNKAALPLEYMFESSKPPKILNVPANKKDKDYQHGLFAVAAKKGDDDSTISTWIGRHPDKGMMLVLDEGTDMPHALTGALPNLEGNQQWFQCIIIGNSNSKYDLHGAMSTPLEGWASIDPSRDFEWPTTQKNGICLFFSCFDSPAIHETDPVRKEKLGKFLITAERIEERAKALGRDSDKFWRMIIGFWKTNASDDVIMTEPFIAAAQADRKAQWSGLYSLAYCAGLDVSYGGDQCILRLGLMGVDIRGYVVLDYRGEELLFRIPIVAFSKTDADIQIADFVIKKLYAYGCPLNHLAIDATGQGRALGSVIQLRANSPQPPIKIYSTQLTGKAVKSWDVTVRSAHELWFAFRDFMMHSQIRGLDIKSLMQFSSRQVITDTRGRQILESKIDYKKRMGAISPVLAHSPDEADSAALCLQAAMISLGFVPGARRTIQQSSTFEGEKYRVHLAEQKAMADRSFAQTGVVNSGQAIPSVKMKFGTSSLASAAVHKRRLSR